LEALLEPIFVGLEEERRECHGRVDGKGSVTRRKLCLPEPLAVPGSIRISQLCERLNDLGKVPE
jgi:hypothetical protein